MNLDIFKICTLLPFRRNCSKSKQKTLSVFLQYVQVFSIQKRFVREKIYVICLTFSIKALQALHETRHCAYFCCCTCFGIKNINVTTRFDQFHQLFHKILSINIILKSIKGHNSVENFGKIMCISHNMDHIYQCINKILSKSIHYF